MFQYAYARSLQEQFNEELYLDTSVYKKYKIRSYSLSNLNINEIPDISEARLSKYKKKYLKIEQVKYRYLQRLYKKVFKTDLLGERKFKKLSRKGLYFNFDRHFYPSINTNKEVKSVYGYFPSEKYFKDIESMIRNELKVKREISYNESIYLNQINECNSVGISIRWDNDYKNSNLNLCNESYYLEGMDVIARKIENPVFFIFSDKIDLIKKDFNFKYPVIYIENFSDFESLRLLYTCKHFVIANSSFSWFGSYLSDNENKVIIAPSRWFIDSKSRPDIYTDNMTIISV